MNKLDLSKYSDREIVSAICNMPAHKFLSVMNALNVVAQRMEKRGRLIAQDHSDEAAESLLRRLLEEEK